jgi:hypothetical protein
MTSRVTPKQCSLREAVGERELCPGAETELQRRHAHRRLSELLNLNRD